MAMIWGTYYHRGEPNETRGKIPHSLGSGGSQTAGDPLRSYGKPEKVENACPKQAFFVCAIDKGTGIHYTEDNI